MGEAIIVGIGEIKHAQDPSDILVAPDLGSGIGVCACDSEQRIRALAHIVLPHGHEPDGARGIFANMAIPALLQSMIELGADARRIRVSLVGGAELRGFRGNGPRLNLGPRNAAAVKAEFERAETPVVAEEIGGRVTRTVYMDGAGHIFIVSPGQRERELVALGGSRAAPARPA